MVVEFNNECFKGEGPQNVAMPCDSAQECFYVRNPFYVSLSFPLASAFIQFEVTYNLVVASNAVCGCII